MFTIKKYKTLDYDMIKSWWDLQNEIGPTKEMLPLESTYILCLKDKPILCVSLYFTNIKEYCYIECFVGNPDAKGLARREGTKILFDYICAVAKQKGYKKVVCLSHNEVLTKYYMSLGLNPTLTNVTTFCKVL